MQNGSEDKMVFQDNETGGDETRFRWFGKRFEQLLDMHTADWLHIFSRILAAYLIARAILSSGF